MAGYTLAPSFQTTSTSSNPWAPAQPALNTALGGAMDAFRNTYNGPLVAGMDPNVTAGQNAQLGIAGQNMTSGAAQSGIGGIQNILASGGIGAPMQYGMDAMKGAIGNLNPIASGAFLQNNPYLNQIIETMKANTANNVNANFSRAGRYGSGAYAGTLGRELGNIEANTRYQDYANNLNNMLQANSQIGNLASGVSGIGQQGIGNVMNAGNALTSYINPLYSDANQMKAVGGERMDYQQAQIDAANQAPWTKVGNLAQIAQGIGGMGGTSNSTTVGMTPMQNQPQPSMGQMIAGGVLGGLGTAANVAKAGGFKGLFSGMF